MIEEFWTGIGDKLAERWIALLLSPALIFWSGGIVAWAWRYDHMRGLHHGWHGVLERWQAALRGLPLIVQGALVIGLLIVVMLSTFIVQRLSRPALRLLAGDWPQWLLSVTAPIMNIRLKRMAHNREKLRSFAAADYPTLTASQRRQYQKLDQRYLLMPADPDRQTVTRLGNTLRAYEGRPLARYGLDATVCWPQLWLLLPDTARLDVSDARKRLSDATQICLWGILFIIWTSFTYWALPTGLLVLILGYSSAVDAAATYGQLFAASFDVHRHLLYRSLRFPLPASPAQERLDGSKLIHYLRYGSRSALPLFCDTQD